MRMLNSKKGMLDPFDITGRIGYYVIAMLIVSILFLFIAVLAQGMTVKYYKSNYGSAVVNLEERAFNGVEFTDALTNSKYHKIIDVEKMALLDGLGDCTSKFDKLIGTDTVYDRKGVQLGLYNLEGELIKSLSTCNFVDGRFDIEKHYPVLYGNNDDYSVGEVRLFFWKP